MTLQVGDCLQLAPHLVVVVVQIDAEQVLCAFPCGEGEIYLPLPSDWEFEDEFGESVTGQDGGIVS